MAHSANSKCASECAIDVWCEARTALVKCKGRLVFGQTDMLQKTVRDLLPTMRRVAIDLSDVDFIDSAGLGTAVRLYVSAKASHCELQFVNLAPRVRELFGLARLLSLFEPYGEYNIRMP